MGFLVALWTYLLVAVEEHSVRVIDAESQLDVRRVDILNAVVERDHRPHDELRIPGVDSDGDGRPPYREPSELYCPQCRAVVVRVRAKRCSSTNLSIPMIAVFLLAILLCIRREIMLWVLFLLTHPFPLALVFRNGTSGGCFFLLQGAKSYQWAKTTG